MDTRSVSLRGTGLWNRRLPGKIQNHVLANFFNVAATFQDVAGGFEPPWRRRPRQRSFPFVKKVFPRKSSQKKCVKRVL